MEQLEATSTAKSIYMLSASLAGLEISPQSPEELAKLVSKGYGMFQSERRPEAVANLLRLIAMTLQLAQDRHEPMLHECRKGAEQMIRKNRAWPFYSL